MDSSSLLLCSSFQAAIVLVNHRVCKGGGLITSESAWNVDLAVMSEGLTWVLKAVVTFSREYYALENMDRYVA